VRVRIADEIERRDHGVARIDLDTLDTQEDEVRPEQVRELAGQEEGAERHGGNGPLGAEPDSEMSDEHGCLT
jgi:hypothetical protein